MNTVFIQTNNKQLFGAKIAEFAIKKNAVNDNEIRIRIINVDTLSIFQQYRGTTYTRKGKELRYDSDDLQSFTLSRFMAPQLMNYQGKAIVIDPDIFAQNDITPLFDFPMQGKAIACCSKKEAWDTSVMLLDCRLLIHWDISQWLEKLRNKEIDYADLISLTSEKSIVELPREWNSLDHVDEKTKFLHTTNRLTQPWKTGLHIDFTRNSAPKIAGIIPREWLLKLKGSYHTTYQPHPNKHIENMFFKLVREAVKAGHVSRNCIKEEIDKKNIRPDIFQYIE